MRGLIDNSVNIGGDQVITGVKTFPNSPIVDTTSNQTIAGIKTFSSRVMAAAATNNGSAATTTARSLASNKGYIKFGNGLIVQYIRASGTPSSNNLTVTLPTPCTSATSYAVSGSITYNGATASGWGHINSCTATNFHFVCDSNGTPANCVIVGY